MLHNITDLPDGGRIQLGSVDVDDCKGCSNAQLPYHGNRCLACTGR